MPSALPSVVQNLDCPKERGRLVANTRLELKDYEGKVWALGDCAAIETVARTKVPPTTQHAIREAATAASNIASTVRGGGKQVEFGFAVLGILGSLGHGAAVAEICGVKLSGIFAWFLWRGVYLMKMPGLNRKARIATDWLLHLIFPPELAQTRAAFESGIRNQHFEPGDIIFQQGDLGDCVYVIEEGECDVLCERKGEQEHLATLGRGAYFGEMALLSNKPAAPRSARVPPWMC